MKNSDIKDPIFLAAVEAIDGGNISLLKDLLYKHPELVSKRLDYPQKGYFENPWLLWFVADNPIRHEKLPANIVSITQLIIENVQQHSPENFQAQIDYTLGLVATGRIPQECGVQLLLMDVLIDAGAKPGNGNSALAHGSVAAAQKLIERGGELNLATAICLGRTDDILLLAKESTMDDRETALVAAAFYGKAEMLSFLLALGVNVNAYPGPSSGFHTHATALHQAVFSGSLAAVKVLVEAGADLSAKDRIFHGTPLGWAKHMQTELNDVAVKKKYSEIETYLPGKENS